MILNIEQQPKLLSDNNISYKEVLIKKIKIQNEQYKYKWYRFTAAGTRINYSRNT